MDVDWSICSRSYGTSKNVVGGFCCSSLSHFRIGTRVFDCSAHIVPLHEEGGGPWMQILIYLDRCLLKLARKCLVCPSRSAIQWRPRCRILILELWILNLFKSGELCARRCKIVVLSPWHLSLPFELIMSTPSWSELFINLGN